MSLTITDFLQLRLRTLVYCKQYSLRKMLKIRIANRPIHHLIYPQPTVITSIHHKTSHSTGNQVLSRNNFYPKIYILIYYSSASLHPHVQKQSPATIFRVPSNQEVRHSPITMKLGHSNKPKEPYQKTEKHSTFTGKVGQNHVTKMFGRCLTKLGGKLLSLHFRFYPKQQYVLSNLCVF